jgi:sugar fermentation stimulation protein A
MKLEPALFPAILLKRYKRFLADVQLDNGDIITVHTPNTGSMMGLSDPGMTIWLRDTQSPTRKYRFSWEMSEPSPGNLVGVHTGIVNQLVSEAILANQIPALAGYDSIHPEQKYGNEKSRIDLLLKSKSLPDCYIEIKNVTAISDNDIAIFPDAVSTRGQKHLRELIEVVRQGNRAVMFFCVQRQDCIAFRPAAEIDPVYANLLLEACQQGVEIMCYQTKITSSSIEITDPLEILYNRFTS